LSQYVWDLQASKTTLLGKFQGFYEI